MKKILVLLSFMFISLSCSDANDNGVEDVLGDDTLATLHTSEGSYTFNKLLHEDHSSANLKTITLYTDNFERSLNIGIWYATIEGNEDRITMSFNSGTYDANGYPDFYTYDSSFPHDQAPDDVIDFKILEDTETNFKATFNGVLGKSYTLNDVDVYEAITINETTIDITF